jgi:pilus assembly protein CpaB
VGVYGSVDSVANRVTRVPIFKGEALVPGRLAPEGTAAGHEVKITPGKRAFGIRVGGGSDIADIIQPNSRVDVMVIIEPGQPNRIAKLFMQNMRVLAIGTVAQRGVDGRVTDAVVATLEVTPEEAERLAIATTEGEIRLVVRGYDNSETGESLTSQAAPQRGCAPSPGQPLVRDLLNRHCSAAVRFLPDLPVERGELRRSRP